MIYRTKINKKSTIINITAAGILNERKRTQIFLHVPTWWKTKKKSVKRLCSSFLLNGKKIHSRFPPLACKQQRT
jgi:hypothetical protein